MTTKVPLFSGKCEQYRSGGEEISKGGKRKGILSKRPVKKKEWKKKKDEKF